MLDTKELGVEQMSREPSRETSKEGKNAPRIRVHTSDIREGKAGEESTS